MAVSKRLRYEVLRRDNHQCKYCGAGTPDVALTVDHVVPTALGGSDDPTNLVAACRDCNAGKTSSLPGATPVADVDPRAVQWAQAMRQPADRVPEAPLQPAAERHRCDDFPAIDVAEVVLTDFLRSFGADEVDEKEASRILWDAMAESHAFWHRRGGYGRFNWEKSEDPQEDAKEFAAGWIAWDLNAFQKRRQGVSDGA